MVNIVQISQLGLVDFNVLDELHEELKKTEIPWREAYSDYQSGGWSTAQLLNSTGSLEQTRLDGLPPTPTQLYEQMGGVRRFIEESELNVLLARLAKVDSGGWLHEHNDNVGLEEETIRLRIHIPIVTNEEAALSIGSNQGNENIFLKTGHMWKLNHEVVPHSASNLGDEARVHLILDCLMNDRLEELLRSEHLDPNLIIKLPTLDLTTEEELIEFARGDFEDGNRRQDGELKLKAEESLLQLFHTCDLEGRSSYDILLRMFERVEGVEKRAQFWRDRLREVRSR